ncbi:MAG: PSD1 and planctomycete cytochrome C domain-containing protein [Gemmataceae bacterium]
MFRFSLIALALLLTQRSATAADGNAFFEKKVRPVLVEKCVSCHGEKKQAGELRVDSRKALLAGGDRGPALVPGKPEESLLIRAVRHNEELKMPQKTKLPQSDIDALAEWVKLGAPWPDEAATPMPVAPKTGERAFTAEEKAFWAFQPVKNPAVPDVQDKAWVKNPIDAFILSKLEATGMKPAKEADRRTLLRRLSFDLTGLPPTEAELEAFLKDESPDAWQKQVDRLLASSAYGEKQGRRWLDVARYADSNGMDENLSYANAWRYRDWVIKAVNADLPYNQFVRDQIAGDLVPGGTDAERADRLTATGFLMVGPKMLAEDDPMKMRMDIIDEQLDTVGQAFMGLTLGCARCHDHKFDPITAADYYGLAGFLYSTKTMRNYGVVAVWHERPIASKEEVAALAAYDAKLAKMRSDQVAQDKPGFRAALGFAAVANYERHRKQQSEFQKTRPKIAEVMAVEDDKGQDLKIHLRGNHLTLGAVAPRRFLKVIAGDTPVSLDAKSSGRLELANWIASPAHPLTARVMANRIWAGHFGSGLVRSADNFGRLGERPSHPELLDYLADEFVKSGWSMKHLHRLIVNSAAYRMSSAGEPAYVPKDPDNRLLSHFNRRRLEAEELRDALFATAGTLDRTPGGTLLTVPNRSYVTSTGNRNYDGYQSTRRAVYLPVVRSAVYDVFQTFDFPDPSVPNGTRAATTIPTQALMFMNGTVTDRAAESFAKAVLAKPGDDATRIRVAYRTAFGRDATTTEVETVLAYLKKSGSNPLAWRGFCRVLFASNEFMYVE